MQEEERETRKMLGSIIAAIGAELVAVKEALDRLSDKTAWLRWLKTHVHYSVDALEGKKAPEKSKTVATELVLSGETREAFAGDAQRVIGQLSSRLAEIRGRKGSLSGDSKQRVLEAIED